MLPRILTRVHIQLNAVTHTHAHTQKQTTRLDVQLAQLSTEVQSKTTTLQDGVVADEAAHVAKIATAERELASLAASLHSLESRSNSLTAFASRLGTRLLTVEAQRKRAEAAAIALRHLSAFATSQDLSTLPEIFHYPDRMQDAAELVQTLSAAVAKALRTSHDYGRGGDAHDDNDNDLDDNDDNDDDDNTLHRRRRYHRHHHSAPNPPTTTRTLSLPPSSSAPPPTGTLQAAAEQLELYRNVLDNRIVARFDTAVAAQDFEAMAECARIMAVSGPRGDSLLISRYISSRPMFLSSGVSSAPTLTATTTAPSSSQDGGGGGGGNNKGKEGEGAHYDHGSNTITNQTPPTTSVSDLSRDTDAATVEKMRSLTGLFTRLSSSLRDEAVVLEQVFPPSSGAVAALTQRMFDQIVQPALEEALRMPPPLPPFRKDPRGGGSPYHPDQLRSHLRLLAEAYKKALALAEEAAELSGASTSTTTISSSTGTEKGGIVPTELADNACGTALAQYMQTEMTWLGILGQTKLAAHDRVISKELILDFMAMNEEAVKRCVQVSPVRTAVAPSVRLLFYSSSSSSSDSGFSTTTTNTAASLLDLVAAHVLKGVEGAG